MLFPPDKGSDRITARGDDLGRGRPGGILRCVQRDNRVMEHGIGKPSRPVGRAKDAGPTSCGKPPASRLQMSDRTAAMGNMGLAATVLRMILLNVDLHFEPREGEDNVLSGVSAQALSAQ